MPINSLTHQLLLPELEFVRYVSPSRTWVQYWGSNKRPDAACSRCPTLSAPVMTVQFAPSKMRPYVIKSCSSKLKKDASGVNPAQDHSPNTSPALKKAHARPSAINAAFSACENFTNLTLVQKTYRASAGYVFKTLYNTMKSCACGNTHGPIPSASTSIASAACGVARSLPLSSSITQISAFMSLL